MDFEKTHSHSDFDTRPLLAPLILAETTVRTGSTSAIAAGSTALSSVACGAVGFRRERNSSRALEVAQRSGLDAVWKLCNDIENLESINEEFLEALITGRRLVLRVEAIR